MQHTPTCVNQGGDPLAAGRHVLAHHLQVLGVWQPVVHARLSATQRLDCHVEAAWCGRQPRGCVCVLVRVCALEGDHQGEGVRAAQRPAAAGAQGAAAARCGIRPWLRCRWRRQAGVEVRQGLPSGCQDAVQPQEVACRQICVDRADLAEVPARWGRAAALGYPLLLIWRSRDLRPACCF
jgi:hypothetical protein